MGSVGSMNSVGGVSNSLSSIKEAVASNYTRTTVDVRDKWGDIIDQHTGYVNSEGSMFNVRPQGKNTRGEQIFELEIGDTSRGFVAANSSLSEQEAWERMQRYLRGERR